MSQFDPSLFLDATISEPNVKRPPIPAGTDVVGVIGDVKARAWQGKKDPTQSGIAMDVQIELDLTTVPGLPEKVGGATKITLTDGIMLDLTEGGMIDNSPGKNGKLRRYREALNLNKPGDVFSFRLMQGRTLKVKIKHETYEGDVYDRVDSVARA